MKYNYVSSHEKWVGDVNSIKVIFFLVVFLSVSYCGLLKRNGYSDYSDYLYDF